MKIDSEWSQHFAIIFEGRIADAVAVDNLLKEVGFTIREIAFYLEYAGQAAFATAFKRRTGTTPRAFQVQNT